METTPIEVVETVDFLKALLESIGGLKGASTLAIVAAVVQLVIMFLKTPLSGQLFEKLTDEFKLLLVTGLTVVAGVSSLMLTEQLPFVAALIHSTTVAALSVFAHQLYKHIVKKDE